MDDKKAGEHARNLLLTICDWNSEGPCSLEGPWGDEVGLSHARCLPAVFDLCFDLLSEKERIFVIEPNHPIMWGLPLHFELEAEEMYGERFDIPAPDKLLAIGWYQSGEVFRSACLFDRGYGKVFYFQPGHETLPSYHNPYVKQVIVNAAFFIARNRVLDRELHSDFAEALEKF